MLRFIQHIFFLLVLFLLAACNDKPTTDENGKVVRRNTPTSGEIKIFVENGYEPLMTTQIEVFEAEYTRAKVQPEFVSENDAVKALINVDIPLAVLSRPLNEKELIPFKNRGFQPEMVCVAYDGVAFIVNPANIDSVFTQEELKNLLNGKYKKWSDLNKRNKTGKINLVFDHKGSGTVRYVRDSIVDGDLWNKAFALNSNQEVIDYVAEHKSAIGVISTNWISDTDDKGSQRFLQKIKLCGIAKQTGDESFTPYQAYLYTGDYPYKRPVYVINASTRHHSLSRGFASFVAGPIGQRIIHKEGLLPQTMPIRLMEIKRE